MLNNQSNKYCELCGHEFTSIRPDAKFCSNSCRTKANNQRRDTELKEAENAKKQAEIDETKRIAKEARKLKKAEKEADEVAKQRLAEIEQEIQAEIDAYELSEKNRGINSIVGMLRGNAEATEKQRLEDEDRRKKDAKNKQDKELKEMQERAEWLINGAVEIIKNLFNQNKEPENISTKLDQINPLLLPQKPGNSILPGVPNSINAELRSIDLPSLNGSNSFGRPYEQTGTPYYENINLAPPNNVIGIHSIVENVLDKIHIFK